MSIIRPLTNGALPTDERLRLVETALANHIVFSSKHNDESGYWKYKYDASDYLVGVVLWTDASMKTKLYEEAVSNNASGIPVRILSTYYVNGSVWRRSVTCYTITATGRVDTRTTKILS